MSEFLDRILERHHGRYVALAFGTEPFRNPEGKYKHRGWAEKSYLMPDQREKLEDDLEKARADQADIYVCTTPRVTSKGRQGKPSNAAPPTVLSNDIDGETDEGLLTLLDPYVVLSGSEGHRHAHVPLTRPVSVAEHKVLNQALARRLRADAKWPENSLFRLPDTLSYKPTVPVNGDAPSEPAPVVWVKRDARDWRPEDLAELLGVDLQQQKAGKAAAENDGAPDAEPAPSPLPTLVQRALDNPDTSDRSKAHHRVVGACRQAGLTLGQAITVVSGYQPSIKYSDGGRLSDEVVRSWEKVDPPADDHKAGSTPDDVPSDSLARFLLPNDVWDSSPLLAHIYQAAMARLVCPDALLHVVITIVASLLDHRSRVTTGKAPSMLSNYFAPVADSGGGKDEAMKAGRELLREFIEGTERFAITGADGWIDDHLGSGEGLIDAFLGDVHRPIVNPDTAEPMLDKDGNQRTEKVRAQIRNNALMSDGEGRRVLALDGRKGSTLLPRLCDMWTGASVGERNTEAGGRSRRLKAETCQVGIILGFQLDTIDALFDDTAGGTPQRFLFAPAQYAPFAEDLDTDVVDEHPGELKLDVSVAPITVTLAPDQQKFVRRAIRAKAGGVSIPEAPNGPLDGHRTLIQCRLAALLSIAHGHGETEMAVSPDMWALAEVLTRHSCALRDSLADRSRQRAERQRETRKRDQVEVHERASAATEYRERLQRAADSLVRFLERNGATPRGTAKAGITSSVKRTHGDAAIEKLLGDGVIVERDGKLDLS